MSTKKKALLMILVTALFSFGITGYHRHESCKERSNAFNIRVDSIRQSVENSLPRGAAKDDVVRFFAANKIPLDFDQDRNEATGTLYTTGCGKTVDWSCSDSALIGVKVQLDSAERVESKTVIGMYTNCL